MAQYMRPDADVALGGWTNPSFSVIDEATANDADFTESMGNPANDILIVSLGDNSDPNTNAGHVLRYRYQNTTSEDLDLVVKLKQGAATIATITHTAIPNVWTQADNALSESDVANITDYNDLRISFDANLTGLPGIPGPKCQISWAELELPNTYVAPTGYIFAS